MSLCRKEVWRIIYSEVSGTLHSQIILFQIIHYILVYNILFLKWVTISFHKAYGFVWFHSQVSKTVYEKKKEIVWATSFLELKTYYLKTKNKNRKHSWELLWKLFISNEFFSFYFLFLRTKNCFYRGGSTNLLDHTGQYCNFCCKSIDILAFPSSKCHLSWFKGFQHPTWFCK